MNEPVLTVKEVRPGVALMTMHDRATKNAFSSELTDALIASFAETGTCSRYRAIVLTGYDSYFACGGTQEGLLAIHEHRGSFTDTNLYSLALECEIPVIAAMQGHGIGGGFVFGMFADSVVLSRESVYTTNFMKYGFTPGMGATIVLPRKLGEPLAHEMLLSARNFRGAELEKRGIAFPVLPRSMVLPYACDLAEELADKPRASLVALKRHLVSGLRAQLPVAIAEELGMHAQTFHLPEVKERITKMFAG